MTDPLIATHYVGNNGRSYAEILLPPDSLGYKLQAEFFLPFIKLQDVVLDFGCGKGGLANQLQCTRIDGFDVNSNVLATADRFYQKTFSKYEEPSHNFYDVIVSNHCLEHIPSPLVALNFVYKWLKPGGKAIFVVPHDCLSRHTGKYSLNDKDHHLYTWSPRALGNLFSEAGFEVLQCEVLRSAWSRKLFPIHKLPVIGPVSRRILCYLLNRPQILCVSRKAL